MLARTPRYGQTSVHLPREVGFSYLPREAAAGEGWRTSAAMKLEEYEWFQRATATRGKGDQEPVRLGTVGGRIVAETLIGLLWGDGSSYLRQAPHWKPDEIRTMGDLISVALS